MKNYFAIILILSVGIMFLVPSYSQIDEPIIVTTDKSSYSEGDTILISGQVKEILQNVPVSVQIIAPSGDLVFLAQLDVGYSKTFSTQAIAEGPMWQWTGTYTIKVVYGTAGTAETTFDFLTTSTVTPTSEAKERVPGWIKNNAKWWSEGQIGDSDFVSGIQYLMKEKTIDIPDLPEQVSETAQEHVPDWIRNNAGWWADGLISEDDFISGIKYLVEQGIIRV